jgi:putative flavoprotein involved in K+ transport
VATLADQTPGLSAEQARKQALGWLEAFDQALTDQNVRAVTELFTGDGSWRDLVAISWHVHSWNDPNGIEAALSEHLAQTRPTCFVLDEQVTPELVPRAGREVIEAFFKFETQAGRGEGVVRLVPDGDQARAWSVMTSLKELKGHEPLIGANRRRLSPWDEGPGGRKWSDRRATALEYKDGEPAVLVVGAGQAGLSAAARLAAVGVDAMIVDREDRVGDNWRNRYARLRLHTETPVNHLPFVPFPDTAPGFMSAGSFGNFLEAYAEIMELNVWTRTEFLGGAYDEDSGTWDARVCRADGTERILHPRHLIIASGLSDIPKISEIEGLSSFAGQTLHSSKFDTGADYRGKRVVVFGAGNSGIDIAEDLHEHGAEVTMVQRGPMTIVNLDPTALMQFSLFSSGIPTDVVDLMVNADPYPVMIQTHKDLTAMIREMDREMIEGLEKAGFRTHYGPDETGNVIQYFRTGGGYYLNVGGAELISEGKVAIKQFEDLRRIVEGGIEWRDGHVQPVDVIVFATGYHPPTAALNRWFGSDVAEAVGEIWGFDDEGELNNMFKRTPQAGLWFLGGGVLHARAYSHWLVIQIQACELGLITPNLN